MTAVPTSEAMFRVCDALQDACRAGAALSLDDTAAAAETLRQAAIDVRIMEEALDRRVAGARDLAQTGLRVIDGGRA